MIRWPRIAALPVLLLPLASCGHSAPTTLHSLSAVPPGRVYAGYAGAPVRVDAVRLPPAIDRVEMLRETGAGRYAVLEFDRWAAPPARLARHALTEDLAARLPAGSVITTTSGDGPPATAIAVDILSFSAGAGGAVLVANWTRGCRPGSDLRRHYVRLEAAGGDAPAALEAMLGQLADRIASDVQAVPDKACPSP